MNQGNYGNQTGMTSAQYGGAQNPANQYGYTSQYRGNNPQHNENRNYSGMTASTYSGGMGGNQYGGSSQYNAGMGGSQYGGMSNQANQYGYTSQYRGNNPQHSEERNYGAMTASTYSGGMGGSQYGAGSQYSAGMGGSQYGGMSNQANQYGYTNQYRGNNPQHSEERNYGGMTASTYSTGMGGSQYGAGSQYSAGMGGSQYGGMSNQANQYGYTNQYRGNNPQHSEERNYGGMTASTYSAGMGGNQYGAGSQYSAGMGGNQNSAGFQSSTGVGSSQYGSMTNSIYQGSGPNPGMNQAYQPSYTSQYRGGTTHHGEGGRGNYGGSY